MEAQEPILKPCPFCGGEAELYRGSQNHDGHMVEYVLVRCTNCKAGTRRTEYPAAEPVHPNEDAKAARLWNRRIRQTWD